MFLALVCIWEGGNSPFPLFSLPAAFPANNSAVAAGEGKGVCPTALSCHRNPQMHSFPSSPSSRLHFLIPPPSPNSRKECKNPSICLAEKAAGKAPHSLLLRFFNLVKLNPPPFFKGLCRFLEVTVSALNSIRYRYLPEQHTTRTLSGDDFLRATTGHLRVWSLFPYPIPHPYLT